MSPPFDTLYLWWLAQPATPVLIGRLQFARAQRAATLQYSTHWLSKGFALSEDLPLTSQEFMPAEKDSAPGAVDDARPDRWGERVIRFVDRPSRLSIMEFLYFAGDERFGALGVSTSDQSYIPRQVGPLPQIADIDTIHHAIQRIVAGEAVEPDLKRLIAPGATLGGARPKALIHIDDAQWVLKFAEPGEITDSPLIEHATMTLAAKAGISAAPTMAIPLRRGHAVAIRRFDREGPSRKHALSAHVALRAAGEQMGYPELAQLLRRRGNSANNLRTHQMRELFRRLVFNILIDNTDDHEKNHALLMNDRGEYELAPAYDVLPTGQALGYQQMRVGAQGSESSIDNALSEAAQFGLTRHAAHQEARLVAEVVDSWGKHFESSGVSQADLQTLADTIDRPFLLSQRRSLIQAS